MSENLQHYRKSYDQGALRKNQALSEALRIKGLPTLIIYKSGDMKWRQSGELDANPIIGLMQNHM